MHKYIITGKNMIEGGIYKMSIIQKIALAITIIGAINWGLIGMFDFNLVEYLFGIKSVLSRVVYIIVFITGLFNIALLFLRNRHRIMEEV